MRSLKIAAILLAALLACSASLHADGISNGGSSRTGARSTSQPANTNINANSASKMLGLAGSITPAASGNVLFMVKSDFTASTSGDCEFQITYGTGTAPLNGAASTGTGIGNLTGPNVGTGTTPTTLIGYATGLTVGTAYWIDVVATTTTTNITCSMFNNTIIAIEQ
jgi:hypothetical protein